MVTEAPPVFGSERENSDLLSVHQLAGFLRGTVVPEDSYHVLLAGAPTTPHFEYEDGDVRYQVGVATITLSGIRSMRGNEYGVILRGKEGVQMSIGKNGSMRLQLPAVSNVEELLRQAQQLGERDKVIREREGAAIRIAFPPDRIKDGITHVSDGEWDYTVFTIADGSVQVSIEQPQVAHSVDGEARRVFLGDSSE